MPVWDAAVEALLIHVTDLDFYHIEPACVLGCVMKFDPTENSTCFFRREGSL